METEAPVDLGAVYDRMTAEPDKEPEQSPTAETKAPEESTTSADTESAKEPDKTEETIGQIEAPGNLPKEVREAWASIPESARNAIQKTQQDMSTKLAENTRLMAGINPIKDVLVKAAREMPNLAGMQPAKVAEEMLSLARVSRDFAEKPVETIIGLMDKHGIRELVKAALGNTAAPQSAATEKEIADLRRQLAQVSDPEYIRSQASSVLVERDAQTEVAKFAATAEHWDKAEEYIPTLIPGIRSVMPNASATEVLQKAYDTAIAIYLPDLKAKEVASTADAVPDPEKAASALKAISVNVTGRAPAQKRELPLRDELGAIWDRAHRR